VFDNLVGAGVGKGLASLLGSINAIGRGLPGYKSPPGLARGGVTQGPALVGEGSKRWPEFVVPTDPRHRSHAIDLYSGLTTALDLPTMATGGVVGSAPAALAAAMPKLPSVMDLPTAMDPRVFGDMNAGQGPTNVTLNIDVHVEGNVWETSKLAEAVRKEIMATGRANGNAWGRLA
jgi:hypothetical protein